MKKKTLELFNKNARKLMQSSYSKEPSTRQLGQTLKWDRDEGFDYSVSNHDEDFINSVLMPLRFFCQNNESISLGNTAKLYEKLHIDEDYKKKFRHLRKEFNDYLDEKALTSLDDKPTRRKLFMTILYGEIAHQDPKKIEILEKWKKNKMDWDLAYIEFQRIIHHFIYCIEGIHSLNQKILKTFN